MKKQLSILVVLVVSASMLLAACGGAATPTKPPAAPAESPVAPSTPTEAASPEAAPAEVVTIRFQDWRLAEEPAATALNNLIAAFENQYPNIKVQPEPVSNAERIDKYNNQLRAGDPPDVVRFNLTELPTEIAMNAFEPLDKYIEAEGGDTYLQDFVDFMLPAGIVDGSVYAIPHEGDSFVLYVNKDKWEAAGLDPVNNPPKTFEELREANLKLTDAANNQYAFGMWPSAQWLQSWFTAYGAYFFNDDYTETYIDSPEGIEAFKFFTGMVTEDKVVPPGAVEVDYGGQVALMAQEQVAYIQGPYATYGGILAANPDLADKLIAIPFPGTGETVGRATHFSIGKGSKNPDAAWEFIKFLSLPENQLKFFEEATMLPSRKSALEQIDLDQYPAAKVMVEQSIPLAKTTYPAFPEWNECRTIITDALNATLLGQASAEDAIKQAASDVRTVLAERQNK